MKLTLPAASHRLKVPYRALYFAVLDGRVEATRERAGWLIDEAALPQVARVLGGAVDASSAAAKEGQAA